MYKDPEKYIFHRFFVQSRLRKLYFLLHTVHDKLLLVIENKFLSDFHDLCMNPWSSRHSKFIAPKTIVFAFFFAKQNLYNRNNTTILAI